MIQCYQLSPSPSYIPICPCSLFQSPRSPSIKLVVPQAWIMQIVQPNYLMATNFPASSLITFQSCIFIFILWSAIDICLGILIHLFFPGVCFSLKVRLHACQFYQGYTKSTEIFPVVTADGNVRASKIYPHTDIPPPYRVALRIFQGKTFQAFPFNVNASPQALEYFRDITQSLWSMFGICSFN